MDRVKSTLTKFKKKSRDVKVFDSFEKMGLKENLLAGIYEAGFSKPSAIQQRAIVPIMEGIIAL